MKRKPIQNRQGTLHLHISGSAPEDQELKGIVESMGGKNTDHDRMPVFNPAVSGPQRRLMAIAEHNPGAVYKKNRGVLKMSKNQLSDFASTKGLKG